MQRNNCRMVKDYGVVATGWAGIGGDKLLLRPTRGSNGFALYDTQAVCLRNTRCDTAILVTLRLEPVMDR